jgi:ssDNA-binding Zn-finger/Zn-ribbon topoisomerase 1
MIHHNTSPRQASRPSRTATLPTRCPRCNDDLALYHTRGDAWGEHPAVRAHFLGCQSYPQCSYTVDYDASLLALIHQQDARLAWCEAQIAWLTCELEVLRELVQEWTP